MHITQAMAAGMGGIRTAGDLVARMQMSQGMRINEAKQYVSEKLGVSLLDLADEFTMYDVRESFNIGRVYSLPGYARGIEAKIRIANILDIDINCINLFKTKSALTF